MTNEEMRQAIVARLTAIQAEIERRKAATQKPAGPATVGTPAQTAPAANGTAESSSESERNSDMSESNDRISMTVAERAARRDEIKARLGEIDKEYSGGELPTSIQEEWDRLREEDRQHKKSIEAQERRRAQLEEVVTGESAESYGERVGSYVKPVRPTNIYDLKEIRSSAYNAEDMVSRTRDNARRAIEQGKYPGVRDVAKAQETVERLLENVDNKDGDLARRILVTGAPAYERAFGKLVTTMNEGSLSSEERTALSYLTDNTHGGYAVPFTLDPTVILTSDGSVNPLRQLARQVQIVNKSWQGVSSAGVTVSRDTEASEVSDDTPTIAGPSVTPTRVQGFIQFSEEIDMDWTQMRSEMTTLLQDAKDQEEADSFLNGNGTSPAANGLLDPTNGITSTYYVAATSATPGTLTIPADLFAVEDAMAPRFRPRASWLAAKTTYNKVRSALISQSALAGDLWVRLSGGQPPELLGYPAYEASHFNSTIAASGSGNNLLMVLGDFQAGFLIVDRVGMSVELVPHIFGSNHRPTGQRGLYAIWRNNSKVLVGNAFRVLNVVSAS